MLRTIKSQIVFLSVSVLIFLCGVAAFFSYLNYQNAKKLTIIASDFAITNFASQIKRSISFMEAKVIDLAYIGEIYYKTNKSDEVGKDLVQQFFAQSPELLGGGIWFEPYALDTKEKRKCFYAYHTDKDKVLLDPKFESDEYDYLNQQWYHEIKSVLPQNQKVGWTTPYQEKQGVNALMTTVGAGIYHNDKLVGLSTIDWKIGDIISTLMQMKPTPNSFSLLADVDNDFVLVSTDPCNDGNNLWGASLSSIHWYDKSLRGINGIKHHNEKYFSNTKELGNGLVLIVNIPQHELLFPLIKNRILLTVFLILTIMLTIFIIYFTLERNISKPIDSLTKTAELLGKGKFDTQINLTKPAEFARLAQTFNKMGTDIKKYITNLNNFTKERERIDAELTIAQKIQNAYLPSTFYPEQKEFDIFASMSPAREVGGDFYDFFFTSPNNLVFLVADVSGKGIPASLFMMNTQDMIKHLLLDYPFDSQLFSKINNNILENNLYDFFVTAFIGSLNITTGQLTYINCGHNYPLIKRQNGNFEYFVTNTNIALGAVEAFKYEIGTTSLSEGDTIFLYTDGLTEALNDKNIFFGEERLKKSINKIQNTTPTAILSGIDKSIKTFVKKTPQSDDRTMLALRFNTKKQNKYSLTIPAKIENYEKFFKWINQAFTELSLPEEIIKRLNVMAEECYVNVSSYGYKDKVGDITINLEKSSDQIILQLLDKGIKFNPLKAPEPNVSESIEKRKIGGLGIFMVKHMADHTSYHYIKGQNVLTLSIDLK